MTSKSELVFAGIKLRRKIYQKSQDGHFSAAQREGFSRLHAYFHLAVEKFFLFPKHGSQDNAYNIPKVEVDQASLSADNVQPTDIESQQSFYDSVHAAAISLRAVTNKQTTALKNVPTP